MRPKLGRAVKADRPSVSDSTKVHQHVANRFSNNRNSAGLRQPSLASFSFLIGNRHLGGWRASVNRWLRAGVILGCCLSPFVSSPDALRLTIRLNRGGLPMRSISLDTVTRKLVLQKYVGEGTPTNFNDRLMDAGHRRVLWLKPLGIAAAAGVGLPVSD